MTEDIKYVRDDLYEVRGGNNDGAYHAGELSKIKEEDRNPTENRIVNLHYGSKGKSPQKKPAQSKKERSQEGIMTKLAKLFGIS